MATQAGATQASAKGAAVPGGPGWSALRDYWFLILAVAVFAAPGLIGLAKIVWSTEQGAQGPIILGTGLWLLVREAAPLVMGRLLAGGRPGIAAAWLVVSFVGYALAGMIGIVWLQWAATYSALIAVGYRYLGLGTLKRLWFPLVYLLFLVPPPYTVMLALTRALKLWISTAAVDVMSTLGFNVASSGTTLYIDQYELLVAAACSGMNSIVSLLAIGLFYIFLRHRSDWRYSLLLACLVVPIAIAANLIRVIVLLLITKYLGNEVAQGMLHEAAGLTMFMIALMLLIGVDAALDPVRHRLGWGEAA